MRDDIHGIHYESGFITYRDCVWLLRDICKNASCIYVKGSERVRYVDEKIFRKSLPVIDLDQCGCPTFKELYDKGELKNYSDQPECFYWNHTDEYRASTKSYNCSLKQVWAFAMWLNKINSIDVEDEKKDFY